MHWANHIQNANWWRERIQRLQLAEDDWKPVFDNLAKSYQKYQDKPNTKIYLKYLFPDVWRIFKAEMQQPLLPNVAAAVKKEYNILIQPVGFSIEPLLLSALTLRPRDKIILLHSPDSADNARELQKTLYLKNYHKFDSANLAADEQDYLNDLKQGEKVVLRNVNPLNLADIFEKLKQDIVGEDFDRIAVDITGGKKSLSASLFTLAALPAINLDTFYIDFEKYDGTYRIPIPGTEFLNFLPRVPELAERTGMNKLRDKELYTAEKLDGWINNFDSDTIKSGFTDE